MNMIPVTSSNIHSVGYEGTTLAVLSIPVVYMNTMVFLNRYTRL